MNDTPQGDGNSSFLSNSDTLFLILIRMNNTPQGDGNSSLKLSKVCFLFQYKNE